MTKSRNNETDYKLLKKDKLIIYYIIERWHI